MSRLILLDNSLRDVGGHHYQYSRDLLQAADESGRDCVLVAHRRFQSKRARLPPHWQVLSLFQHDGYSSHALCLGRIADGALGADGLPLQASTNRGLSSTWRRWRRTTSRQRYLKHFEATLRMVFERIGFDPDDRVLLATCSDFDLLGLVRYLKSDPRTQQPHWQLQFHFNLLEGREAEYEEQAERLHAARRQFTAALQQVPRHRISFYNTTAELSRQYNRLGVAHFENLGYPASPRFAPSTAREPAKKSGGGRWQLTCAGHLRREKGKKVLDEFVQQLDRLPVASDLQVNIQTDRTLRRRRRGGTQHVRIQAHPHPLTTTQYGELVRNSHIGVFLYDSRRYYSRCSGILVEMLASGVPVIVPSGCWLSAQLERPLGGWLQQVADRYTGARTITIQRPPPEVEVALETAGDQLLIEVEPARPFAPGEFLRLDATQLAGDRPRTRAAAVVRSGGGPGRWLVDRGRDCDRLSICFSAAFGGTAPRLAWVRVTPFAAGVSGRREPQSAVGLVAADLGEMPKLVAEMVRNYDHYRTTALEFSKQWRHDCAPQRIVERLFESPAVQRRAA
jgi:hypothetical protein